MNEFCKYMQISSRLVASPVMRYGFVGGPETRRNTSAMVADATKTLREIGAKTKMLEEREDGHAQNESLMIIYPRHFVRFIDGRAGKQINIAFLPGELGRHIATLETNVMLRLDYAHKIIRHQICYQEFEEIQNTIDRGLCMKESQHELSFLYVKDRVRPEIYYLVIKTPAARNELWLKTFYRIRKTQYAKKLRPYAVLRAHAEDEFMG